ncbi:DUF3800 domain-containing protein [Brevibacterium sediminis]|uniref:DUF3800 domain-containing protein n=1 Tax=Brevibacterium sediminis TaxID=1857024 RepID=UPI00366F537C
MNFWHPDLPSDMSEEEVDKFVNDYKSVSEFASTPVPPSMLVYVDDSGDGGFKFDSGSSSHLIMAAVVFKDLDQMSALKAAFERCRAATGHKAEFKFAKTKDRVKDSFFAEIEPVEFKARVIVINKNLIWARKYRQNASMLKNLAIHQLLDHGFGHIRDAKVFLDGQDTKAFGIPDSHYVMNSVKPGAIREVKFADSKSTIGVQLADMVAGAVNWRVRTHKHQVPKYFEILFPRMIQPEGTLWHFK